MNNVFGLDIGTRNVVGTVGYQTDDKEFVVTAQYVREHETRAMLDGQIHDIGRVAKTIKEVKDELEKQTGQPLEEVCIAAAGRVLKTVTTHVEYEYAQESVVTGEDVHTLNLLGIEKAQEALKEVNDTSYKFYCVGYSTVKFFLNDEVFISLEGHKANKIGEDIIVTFLPEDVVDGLYAAVGQAGLSVANMTLEPIAAINVAIPENYRMLNIALVDVGAGTSDISITRDGSIIAYGMIPHAGDEMTEVIVQHFLVDFNMAESIKLQSTTSDTVTYKDIMSIEHTIPAQDVWDVAAPVVDNIAQEVSAKIRELNGDKTVSACFVVGGGGKIHGFTEKLAEDLDLPEERVALRGEEVLGDVTFEQEDIKKDPLLVTPIGICLNYYDQRNNFIMVRFNGERIKLYDNNRLTIVDAALQAGFSNDELFPKRGTPINFTVNGVARLVRGEAGEGAVVTMNGKPASINTPLEPNSEIVIEPSKAGEAAVYKISQLDEYNHSVITFVINGRKVSCPRFVQVNGRLEPEDYSIRENDVIETRNYYTVRQIAQFMDLVIDTDQMIFVNNEEADLDTLVYENFSVEWKTDEYGVARIDNNNYNDTQESDSDDASVLAEQDANSTESDNTVTRTSEQMMNQVLDELHDEFAKEAEASAVPENELPENELPKNDIQEEIHEENSSENTVTVIVNGEPVELSGKDTYIFVDIFTHISFDLQAGKGRAIATVINGRDAQFSEELHEGDKIELYWKEN
ncbi:pilus assembly protein PilM [Agathobacter rectalis]|uniref:pilus assembly protein PilM n=1 Tax=Agathobacter rectalis TaxID=39491 RepID=UPI0021F9B4AD|nr:pilus assembly protein PilM [Agathobacter rectalis]UTB41720.1 pilus assembly protein PilM [Agathobacter rectalis]